MELPKDKNLVTRENGFIPTKALDITRFYMYGKSYIEDYGPTVTSLEGVQNVTEDCIVLFDDCTNLIGYPASAKAFAKYDKLVDDFKGGIAVKKDSTEYLSKKMDAIFSAVIWNGDVITGKVGDYLVANVENDDYRIVAAEVFEKSYAQVL